MDENLLALLLLGLVGIAVEGALVGFVVEGALVLVGLEVFNLNSFNSRRMFLE